MKTISQGVLAIPQSRNYNDVPVQRGCFCFCHNIHKLFNFLCFASSKGEGRVWLAVQSTPMPPPKIHCWGRYAILEWFSFYSEQLLVIIKIIVFYTVYFPVKLAKKYGWFLLIHWVSICPVEFVRQTSQTFLDFFRQTSQTFLYYSHICTVV